MFKTLYGYFFVATCKLPLDKRKTIFTPWWSSLLLLLIIIAHFGACFVEFSRILEHKPEPRQDLVDNTWVSYANTYCTKSAPTLTHDDPEYGLSLEDCKNSCLKSTICNALTYGVWTAGPNHGKRFCNRYEICAAKSWKDTNLFVKVGAEVKSPDPEFSITTLIPGVPLTLLAMGSKNLVGACFFVQLGWAGWVAFRYHSTGMVEDVIRIVLAFANALFLGVAWFQLVEKMSYAETDHQEEVDAYVKLEEPAKPVAPPPKPVAPIVKPATAPKTEKTIYSSVQPAPPRPPQPSVKAGSPTPAPTPAPAQPAAVQQQNYVTPSLAPTRVPSVASQPASSAYDISGIYRLPSQAISQNQPPQTTQTISPMSGPDSSVVSQTPAAESPSDGPFGYLMPAVSPTVVSDVQPAAAPPPNFSPVAAYDGGYMMPDISYAGESSPTTSSFQPTGEDSARSQKPIVMDLTVHR